MIDSSPAARLVLVEAAALEPVLRRAPTAVFSLPTVCDGWSVRDVLAHCSAALQTPPSTQTRHPVDNAHHHQRRHHLGLAHESTLCHQTRAHSGAGGRFRG